MNDLGLLKRHREPSDTSPILEYLKGFFRINELSYAELVIQICESDGVNFVAHVEIPEKKIFGLVISENLVRASGLGIDVLIQHFVEKGSHVMGLPQAGFPPTLKRRVW